MRPLTIRPARYLRIVPTWEFNMRSLSAQEHALIMLPHIGDHLSPLQSLREGNLTLIENTDDGSMRVAVSLIQKRAYASHDLPPEAEAFVTAFFHMHQMPRYDLITREAVWQMWQNKVRKVEIVL